LIDIRYIFKVWAPIGLTCIFQHYWEFTLFLYFRHILSYRYLKIINFML